MELGEVYLAYISVYQSIIWEVRCPPSVALAVAQSLLFTLEELPNAKNKTDGKISPHDYFLLLRNSKL